jgi:AmmeMemoRadiSam system protein B
MDEAHATEHSLEVHLPFLQAVLDDFSLVPIIVGETSADFVADVLDALWGGPETLIVVSSTTCPTRKRRSSTHAPAARSSACKATASITAWPAAPP